MDLVEVNGVTRREVMAMFGSAVGERLRSEPLLDASLAGSARRVVVAVVAAYVAAVGVIVAASLAWIAVSAIVRLYLVTVSDRFESRCSDYLVFRWHFLWRMSLVAALIYVAGCVVLASPAVALLAVTRWGFRWPVPARVVVAMAFVALTMWAMGPLVAAVWTPVALCFALVMVPARCEDLPLTTGRTGPLS